MSSKLVFAELAHKVEQLEKKLRKEKRMAKAVDGERIKRTPNHYAEFVSKHINSMPESTPQLRMKAVARLYREDHDGRTKRKVEHRKTEPERELKQRARKTVGKWNNTSFNEA
jgi:hypothetical protein